MFGQNSLPLQRFVSITATSVFLISNISSMGRPKRLYPLGRYRLHVRGEIDPAKQYLVQLEYTWNRQVIRKGMNIFVRLGDWNEKANKGRVGEVYNIGGHNERTNLEVVKTILKALNKPESLIKFVTDRPGHDRRYAIDPTKIETELGWKPKYNFDTGIQQTIQWYLDNQEWWKNILSGEYSNYFDKMYGNRL